MYFDEDMLLDLRLNILDQYVSKFVICEATYNHKGISKKLNFDIKKFKKFEKKIIYTVLDQNPPNLKKIDSNEKPNLKNSKILHNSITRDVFQRNHLMSKISDFVDDDLILISDLDEVPNLEQFRYKNKINIFCQKMFYYKLNLIYPNFVWHGTKACKKRHLNSPQWLRNIKSKKYGFWRLDTLFSNQKYIDINFINNGGWHFTNVKKPEDIHFKMSNFAHHLEYEESGMKVEDLREKISNKKIFYNHAADKSSVNKWNSNIDLRVVEDNHLPKFLINNKKIYKEWLEKN
tara:strand:+ start:10877 stop:11746 length:870 start_codon:yes stop_codon:yes gene_type:complete